MLGSPLTLQETIKSKHLAELVKTLEYLISDTNVDVVSIIKQSIGVHILDKHLHTLMHCAAASGNLEIVKDLYENGAGIRLRGEQFYNMLHDAIKGEKSEVVEFLL